MIETRCSSSAQKPQIADFGLLKRLLAAAHGPADSATRTLVVVHCGTVDYAAALDLQHRLVAARLGDKIGDVLLLLEHPHVYTLGRGADQRFLLNPGDIPVHRVSRGGQVTYHGPGQLIGYPIVRLEGAERDVIRFLRKLEQVIIASLALSGIQAGQRAGLTGVWIGAEKIASIGVGFRRWVSLHGFAVNVTSDLNFFERIVPCGIDGCRMTSMASLGCNETTTQSFATIVEREFASIFGYQQALKATVTAKAGGQISPGWVMDSRPRLVEERQTDVSRQGDPAGAVAFLPRRADH
jgi:lipoate-protein ligase B